MRNNIRQDKREDLTINVLGRCQPSECSSTAVKVTYRRSGGRPLPRMGSNQKFLDEGTTREHSGAPSIPDGSLCTFFVLLTL